MYEVICADGVKRHRWDFVSKDEAEQFAEWGHCCLAQHTIRQVPAVHRTVEDVMRPLMDTRRSTRLGNVEAREGQDRCACGCKYWEQDRCVDCGEHVRHAEKLS